MTVQKPFLEKLLWWAMLAALGIFIGLLLTDMIIHPWLPEEVAFILGIALFYLLASQLLFGYGALSQYLEKMAQNQVTQADAEKAYDRSGARRHGLLEEITHYGLATLWLDRFGPYRYAYMGLYLLLAAYVVVTNLDPVTGWLSGSAMEGFFWGATVISIFVFGADLLVRWQYGQLISTTLYHLNPKENTPSAIENNSDPAEGCPDPDDKACQEAARQS